MQIVPQGGAKRPVPSRIQRLGEDSSPTRNPAQRLEEEALMTWTEFALMLTAVAQLVLAAVAVIGVTGGAP